METHLPFTILPQPTQTTCGPTCLHAIYRYNNDTISLKQVISETSSLEEGGTLAVFLACHALRRGYEATIITYNVEMFDPTWFAAQNVDIRKKLEEQARVKKEVKLRLATRGYLEFIDRGGRLIFRDLNPSLIRKYLKRGIPIVTGLCSTYLHRAPREHSIDTSEDDVGGTPTGHFVVLYGYDKAEKQVLIADPLKPNPIANTSYYHSRIDRVICSILLGILTHDANLLILQKPEDLHAEPDRR